MKTIPAGHYMTKHGPVPNCVTDSDMGSATVIADGLLTEPMGRDELIIHLATWRRYAIEAEMQALNNGDRDES